MPGVRVMAMSSSCGRRSIFGGGSKSRQVVDQRIANPSVSLWIPNNSSSVFEAPPSALGVSEDVQIDLVAVADRPQPAIRTLAPIRHRADIRCTLTT